LLNSAPVDFIGLCSTCNNNDNNAMPNCGLRMRRGFDAIFCELFDTYSEKDPGSRKDRWDNSRPKTKKSGMTSSNNLKGLCINCEHRESCLLPKPDGGVWHCEEYE
jgi:hypothetical protein